jgi:putative membrane-bound dehydrogenase-like protein
MAFDEMIRTARAIRAAATMKRQVKVSSFRWGRRFHVADYLANGVFALVLIMAGTPAALAVSSSKILSSKFIGAPEPGKNAKESPLMPREQKATFTLPPGFEIELVAAESEGIGKFVAIDWDLQGRLWSMTALEYPVDANESPEVAEALFSSKGRDKVVVWENHSGSGPHRPRIFAEGLAIPLGILPYKNGVYVQHGPEIVFLSDTNGDGRADQREVILSGFGIQDSHLFPHQFTRAPGNWIWMAQGAFNYGEVRTSRGEGIQFDQTRMARFRHDGSEFEITSQGPCNIWGLVINGEGETWIQEANDYGYPAMRFHEHANYPGCSEAQWKSYAPEFPGSAPHFRMGGTGLSGLALSDMNAWPEPYSDVMYVANPITRKIQAIKIQREGPRHRLEKLPDFIQSSDEWFRPVAIRFGPDGCLYIVDWYNKIIAHNEVPRNHPERDKTRGRIWRVKRADQALFAVPDFTRISGEELVGKLGGESLTQSHLAWQAITDRQLKELSPKLESLVTAEEEKPARRIAALWALEGLRMEDLPALEPLLSDPNRNIRREAVRALGKPQFATVEVIGLLEGLADDPDPEVRAQVIRTAGPWGGEEPRALALCVKLARAPLTEPVGRSTHSGRTIKIEEAYEREFERYLARLFLERHPEAVAAFLDSPRAKSFPVENLMVASLALEPRSSARQVANLLPGMPRPPGQEELLRLVEFVEAPGVFEALKTMAQNRSSRIAVLEALLKVRTRVEVGKLEPILLEAARALWSEEIAGRDLALRLTAGFKLRDMESDLQDALGSSPGKADEIAAVLRTLRELGPSQIEGILRHARGSNHEIASQAVLTLASSRHPAVPSLLLEEFWHDSNHMVRRGVLAALIESRAGARAVVRAVKNGAIEKVDLNSATLDKLRSVLPEDAELEELLNELAPLFRPALRLDGRNDSWVESNITLDGPFTVETWIRLEPGIDNNDGILGAPGNLDMNFYNGHFRVWTGGEAHDAIVAGRKMVAGVWTHIAVTRDEEGKFRIYLNGELDAAESKAAPQRFENCRIGWTGASQGTAGLLMEFRVWDRALTAEAIRNNFDRTYDNAFGMDEKASGANVNTGTGPQPASASAHQPPRGLVFHAPGAGPWGKLQGNARIENTADFPALMTVGEALQQEAKFNEFRKLAGQPGEVVRGKQTFEALCSSCHSVDGEGGQIGPVLSGAGAMGTESLLRALLTPNAAMEAGYRAFRVELMDGEVLDGMLVSEDQNAMVLRRVNSEDLRIPQNQIKRAAYTKLSLMPEGLLEGLEAQEVADLFAYLQTLK